MGRVTLSDAFEIVLGFNVTNLALYIEKNCQLYICVIVVVHMPLVLYSDPV